MGFEERNAWVLLVIGIVAYATYVVLLLAGADGAPLVDTDYQRLMLGTILGALVAAIVATIAVHILTALATGDRDLRTDQRDRQISAFGTRVGQSFLVIGGLAALLMALAEWDWFWIANVLYLGFVLSGVTEGVARVVAYRRGLPQW